MHAIARLTTYLRASKEEMKKIAWPSRKDTVRYSVFVLAITILMAALFGGLDYGFNKLLAWILQ
ncbi:preprotein translocase subunit SecE [Candidatus Uhrbacteria bacterium]|nr:preprotein translocase subunit SecE [Candidatus Uhrbacteria bacterium]